LTTRSIHVTLKKAIVTYEKHCEEHEMDTREK